MTTTQQIRMAKGAFPLCTIKRLTETGEWKVNIVRRFGGSEDTEYYTSDLTDAIDTMRAMNAFATEQGPGRY